MFLSHFVVVYLCGCCRAALSVTCVSVAPWWRKQQQHHPVAHLVQQVGGLHQLRPQRVEQHIWSLQLPVVSLGQSPEAFPDGVVEGVQADGVVDVAVQHLDEHSDQYHIVRLNEIDGFELLLVDKPDKQIYFRSKDLTK